MSEVICFSLFILALFLVNGFALSFFFSLWRRHVETRKEVLPLCILTVLHILVFIGCWIFEVPVFLFWFYVYTIPAVLLFFLIAMITLAVSSRVTRHIGIAVTVFAIYIILHPVLIALFIFLYYYFCHREIFW